MANSVNKIYVLHEYGSSSHYNGLAYLCEEHGIQIVYREFRFLHLIGSGIKHRNLGRIFKQAVNFLFLLSLLFTRGKKIVLGMYPYDKRLPILSFLLRNHVIYYHTSYTTWFPEEMERTHGVSKRKQQRLKRFINVQVRHIFAVTTKAKESLCAFTGVEDSKVSVVYHSYRKQLNKGIIPPLENYIYVGRMDVSKGIEEMCQYFLAHPKLTLTLIGVGNLVPLIQKYMKNSTNIKYVGFVKGLDQLKEYYKNNAYFILNSKRTKEWEELFGQVVIEAMSCGCVPICSNHSGPKEIITSGVNGFLFDENKFKECLNQIQSYMTNKKFEKMRNEAYSRGHDFESRKIAKKWIKVLS